ncbi:fibronectin type III domain-containing protein [Candidatus Woesebacteria bacterium]|nr:fibronectin type III domain-containing protein [Candidatus Woesebacteria bacterium]
MGPTSYFHIKHIPTLLGLLILAAGLIGGILVVNNTNTNSFLPRAAPESEPKDVKITNVSDTTFTVSWTTDTKTTGFIQYGTSNLSLTSTAQDDRNQLTGESSLYKTHHVTVRSLRPNTTYYFKIGTGNKELYDNSGKPYETKTVGAISGSAQTIYGEVVTMDKMPANGAILYVSADNLSPLSVLTQSTGSFVLPLSQARSKNLQQATTLTPTEKLTLFVVSPSDSSTSLITIKLSDSQPIPEIVLGTNHDFTQTTSVSTPELPNLTPPTPAQSKFTTQLLSPPTEVISPTKLEILVPTVADQTFTTSLPTFSGVAPAQTAVKLTISGAAQLVSTPTTDDTGAWEFRPTVALKKGSYTLTASASISGLLQSTSRSFSINTATTPTPTSNPSVFGAMDEIVVDDATPSASSSATLPVAGNISYTLALIIAGMGLLVTGSYLTFAKPASEKV